MYILKKQDIGFFISFKCYSEPSSNKKINLSENLIYKNPLGPVLPGPPRLLSLELEKIDDYLVAEYNYIGGSEGYSEFWWIKIREDGKRQQISDPICSTHRIIEKKLETLQDLESIGEPRVLKIHKGFIIQYYFIF